MKEWRNQLSTDANEAINHLVRRAKPNRPAFVKNKQVRTNQLWVAMAEVHQDMTHLRKRLTDTEEELTRLKGILHRTGEELTKR